MKNKNTIGIEISGILALAILLCPVFSYAGNDGAEVRGGFLVQQKGESNAFVVTENNGVLSVEEKLDGLDVKQIESEKEKLIESNKKVLSLDGLQIDNESIKEAENTSDVFLTVLDEEKPSVEKKEKNFFGTTKKGLEEIMALDVVDFNWKKGFGDDGKGTFIGLVNEEVHKKFPFLTKKIQKGKESFWVVDSFSLSVLAVRAIQNQQEQIEEIKRMIIFEDGPLAVLIGGVWHIGKDVIFGSKVTFEESVDFLAQTTFMGRIIFTDRDMAGLAIIKKDSDKTHITFKNSYNTKPYVVASSNSDFASLRVANVSAEGFDILIKEKPIEDLELTWQAVAIFEK